MRIFLAFILAAFLAASGLAVAKQAAAQDAGEPTTTAPVVEEPSAPMQAAAARASVALENLRKLIENRQALLAELDALVAAPPAEGEAAGDGRAEEIEALRSEVDAVTAQMGAIAAGVSEEEFRGQGAAGFDLNKELQALVEPFVAMMRDATENARQIERLRREGAEARRREALARRALETLRPVRDAVDAEGADPALAATLDAMAENWRKRADAAADLTNALDQQLADRMNDPGHSREAVNQAASNFFRERGLNLLLGVSAFAAVFVTLRLARRLASWIRVKRRIRRSFYTRLANLLFAVFAAGAAMSAMLFVFNLRNDWLLLGVFALMLLALAWVGIKMLPGAIEQVTLLLNLGAVQEDERVLIEGIPYRVQNLDFYIDFTNPALEGADFTLPVRTVVGMHSRPSGANEPWFPTMRGDWTRLVDGRFGQVKSQSPDMVELEIPGGARMTYATADFLALKPENLSNGFRAEIVFGLSYRHQEELPGAIMDTLREHVREGVARLAPIGCLRDVDVSMLEAGDNAVNFEVEADLAGAAAPLLEDVERELVRLCVEACNRHGWEIPFPQLVIHKA